MKHRPGQWAAGIQVSSYLGNILEERKCIRKDVERGKDGEGEWDGEGGKYGEGGKDREGGKDGEEGRSEREEREVSQKEGRTERWGGKVEEFSLIIRAVCLGFCCVRKKRIKEQTKIQNTNYKIINNRCGGI